MKLNKSLILGSLILIIILFVIVAPSLFTDINPYSVQTLKYTVPKEGTTDLEFIRAPFEPSETAIFGTDEIGRDIFSFIIYGTRLTLKIALWVTLFRFLLAIPFGMFAAFGNNVSKTIIRQFNILFNGLPSLLFAALVLSLSFFANLDKEYSALAYIAVLTIVGWSKLAQALEDLIKNILIKPFITTEYALGKSKYGVAIENVIPHIMPEIVVLLFMEMARVLTMMIQLGIFSIFIGNLKLVLSTDQGNIIYRNISFEPEWASLLGSARAYLRVAPWIVVYPALAFFISVLGFNLFGEGIRIKLQDKNSLFIPKVRKVLVVIFLRSHRKTFIKSLLGKKNKTKKYIIILALMVLIITPIIIKSTSSRFKGEVQAFTAEDVPDKLVIGMQEIESVTDRLSSEMKNLGLEPLYDDYKKYYDIESMYFTKDSTFIINDNEFRQDSDYVIYSFGNYEVNDAPLFDASLISLYDLKDLSILKGHVVLLDDEYYSEEAIVYFIDVFSKADIKGILVKGMDRFKVSVGNEKSDVPVLLLRGDFDLKQNDKISIAYQSEKLSEKGVNVIGILPGNDEKIGEECIIIGMPLNYLDKEDGINTYNYSLELIEKMVKNGSGRSLIFAFFDGNYSKENHGIFDYKKKMIFAPLKTIMYLDIMNIEYGDGNKILVDKEQSPETRYFGVSFLQVFTDKRNNVDVEYMKIPTPADLMKVSEEPHLIMFNRKGVTTVVMDVKSDPGTFFEALLDTLIRNN